MRTFSQEVFEYLTTLVPYWRVSDEGWPLGEDDHYLTGIGVERNFGGQVMVVPWDDDSRQQLGDFAKSLGPLTERIIAMIDDREPQDMESIAATISPIAMLPWSRRSEIATFIVKDTAG